MEFLSYLKRYKLAYSLILLGIIVLVFSFGVIKSGGVKAYKNKIHRRILSSKSIEVWNVDSAIGNDAGDGSIEYPYRTITRALEVADDGDTISVKPGFYDEFHDERFPINLKRGVRLVGERGSGIIEFGGVPGGATYRLPDMPIIYGGAEIEIAVPGGDVLSRFVTIKDSSHALISGLAIATHITSPEGDIRDISTGILCHNTGDTVTISNNIFFGYGNAGINILGNTSPRIENNQFSSYNLNWGIAVRGSGRSLISGNQFECLNGVLITDSSAAVLTGNTISNCQMGIKTDSNSSPTIQDNRISRNGHYGILIKDGAHPIISAGNRIISNRRSGILIKDEARADIFDNTVSNNTNYGIHMENNASSTIRNNTFNGNGAGSYYEDGVERFYGGICICDNATADLGREDDPGGNQIAYNNYYELINYSVNDIYAYGNTWQDPVCTRYINDIFDQEDDPDCGEVFSEGKCPLEE